MFWERWKLRYKMNMKRNHKDILEASNIISTGIVDMLLEVLSR